jgi:hypothetical protein
MSIPLALWIVIIAALLGAYVYRKMVASGADELVHLSDASDAVLAKQQALAGRLEQLDKLLKILALLVVVYGALLGGITIYRALM